MTERRIERKNDGVLMKKIDDIIVTLGVQSTDIAVIKSKSEATEDHLKTLNSKVALQEGRQQATDSALSLNSQAIGILLKEKESDKSFWERNWEKLFWFILAASWAYLNIHK